ncbi:hypothetical protein MLD38_012029 [Melastoma candidum]|uniref:Uncharacterized protein n=1 Tax=Melastoma candidum TaxID=119954 RepID=A0ACB9R521_9MYRT|nr:hypothetical protein MLD38_012029 [Melastoma candidum]
MGSKEGNESSSAAGGSSVSIVLLQERFRQLQRLKEMREEKDPLRLINKATKKVSGHVRNDLSPKYVSPRERNLFGVDSSSMLPLSLSLGRNELSNEFCPWYTGSSGTASYPPCVDVDRRDDDVDTSLHL